MLWALDDMHQATRNMRIVFLFDVDNTLLDTDRVTADVRRFLSQQIAPADLQDYLAIFDRLRTELGYADYLGALQQYRIAHPHDTDIMYVSLYLLNYHFANRLFAGSLDAVEHAKTMGMPVILSDGDVVFQPFKIENAGLLEAFEHRVLIYIHKEDELEAVRARFPADHYVMLDDKLRILDATKKAWGTHVTTIWVREGHYAQESKYTEGYLPPDIMLEHIADLMSYDPEKLLAAANGKGGS